MVADIIKIENIPPSSDKKLINSSDLTKSNRLEKTSWFWIWEIFDRFLRSWKSKSGLPATKSREKMEGGNSKSWMTNKLDLPWPHYWPEMTSSKIVEISHKLCYIIYISLTHEITNQIRCINACNDRELFREFSVIIAPKYLEIFENLNIRLCDAH